jgi:hypothetical protein
VDSPFITELRAELTGHLRAITAEAAAIRRVLAALDPPVRPRANGSAPDAHDELLRELADGEAARASILALALERDVEQVQSALRELERGGAVERDGLGWRIVDPRNESP